jgi:hypothetical protein
MKKHELEVCLRYDKCPLCQGILSSSVSGFIIKKHVIICDNCKNVWDKSQVFLDQVDEVHVNSFIQSKDYVLIHNFVNANIDLELDAKEYEKLKKILELKGYKVSDKSMKRLYLIELGKERVHRFKNKIRYYPSMDQLEIIEAFVKYMHIKGTDIEHVLNTKSLRYSNLVYSYEKDGNIIIKSKEVLDDRLRNEITKLYNKLGGAVYHSDKGKSVWILSWETRVKFVYDPSKIDVLLLLLDEIGEFYDKEEICKRVYYSAEKYELEQFELKLKSKGYEPETQK